MRNFISIKTKIFCLALLGLNTTGLMGCAASQGGTSTGNPAVADTSSSGAVAGALGGSLSGSSSGGMVTQNEIVSPSVAVSLGANNVSTLSASCPTYANTGADCATSGSSMWLTYNSCKFPTSADVWTGVQSLTMSTGTAACGTFPAPGANNTLYRQYVSASGSTTSSTLLMQKSVGDIYVDNHSSNLSNFDSDTLAPLLNAGYGAEVNFNSSNARSSVTLGQRVYMAGAYDHSIYGNFSVSETAGASSRTLSGSVSVYHNLLKIVGTSVFSGLGHNDMCCLPISGSIVTTFQAGTNISPTSAGASYIGKSETLTFTGCGTANLLQYDGTTKSVLLNKCF